MESARRNFPEDSQATSVCELVTLQTMVLNVLSYSLTRTDVNCSQGHADQLNTIITCYQSTRSHKETATRLIKSNQITLIQQYQPGNKNTTAPCPLPSRRTLLPFINYRSLRFTNTIPSNEVRFGGSFWSYANCRGSDIRACVRPCQY